MAFSCDNTPHARPVNVYLTSDDETESGVTQFLIKIERDEQRTTISRKTRSRGNKHDQLCLNSIV